MGGNSRPKDPTPFTPAQKPPRQIIYRRIENARTRIVLFSFFFRCLKPGDDVRLARRYYNCLYGVDNRLGGMGRRRGGSPVPFTYLSARNQLYNSCRVKLNCQEQPRWSPQEDLALSCRALLSFTSHSSEYCHPPCQMRRSRGSRQKPGSFIRARIIEKKFLLLISWF